MITFLKTVARLVIPLGTEAIVGGITANAVSGMTKGTKVIAAVSSAVIGWWIGEKAEEWLEDEMDQLQIRIDEQYKLKGADE